MPDNSRRMYESIVRDMSEGVMTIGMDGVITSLNAAGERILSRPAGELVGQSFAGCFFEYPENDAFNQAVLDAVYDPSASHETVVPYYTGEKTRQLHVTTSYLKEENEKIGVIAVLGDISELVELRDAVRAMERIKELNGKLTLRNRLLSETFGRFLSDEIVKQLLDTRDGMALGGHKRDITILMSDLRGFTALSERMAPHDLIAMLNHYLGEMTEVIQSRGGTIIEFIGDGIMAVFGALAPVKAHAADGVAAAIEMESRMELVNEWNRLREYPQLEMGIGVHTGGVIVGNIGSEKRMKYGAVGNDVNICGRIESYTVGGQVLVSEQTWRQLGVEAEAGMSFEVHPKGAAAPMRLYQAVALGAPYGVSCRTGREEPAPLTRPLPVRFQRIQEKHCDGRCLEGTITALSRRGAVLVTQEPLKRFDNLSLELGGAVQAKAEELRENGWLLWFTFVPIEFDLERMTGGEEE